MTTFIVAGTSVSSPADANTLNIDLADTINPITGGIGLKTVRFLNKGTGVLTATWTPHSVTYEFADVEYTTGGSGVQAVVNVSSTYTGYVVTFANAGIGFDVSDTLSILGTALGGTTTANDLVITVTAVDTDGAITDFTVAGTQLWPQSADGTLVIDTNGEEFVQVTGAPADGCYFTLNNGDTGLVYITPVDIVG